MRAFAPRARQVSATICAIHHIPVHVRGPGRSQTAEYLAMFINTHVYTSCGICLLDPQGHRSSTRGQVEARILNLKLP
jgi:hypothetical protein